MAAIYNYQDPDDDLVAIFDAGIPMNGTTEQGIKIRTTLLGCSIPMKDIPELIGVLQNHYDSRESAPDDGHAILDDHRQAR